MAEFDSMLLNLILLGMLAVIPITFFFARWKDIHWRGDFMRKYLKRSMVLIYILSKDDLGLKPRLANIEQDVLNIGDYIWVLKQSRIFRKDKPEMGTYIEKKNIKWIEGLPCVFIDYDTLKPRTFIEEESNVKPNELGSTLAAWVANQLAKGMAAIKNQDMLLKIIAVLCVVAVFLSYTAMDTSSKTLEEVKKLESSGQVTVPKGGTLQNGTIVVTQPGVKTGG